MLVRRLSPSDVAAVMNCSLATARTRMRQMVHTERPLTVTEVEIERWYATRTYEPRAQCRQKRTYQKRISPAEGEKYLIPRRRPPR